MMSNNIKNIFTSKLSFIHHNKISQLQKNFGGHNNLNGFIFDTELINQILDEIDFTVVDTSKNMVIHIPETLERVIRYKNSLIEVKDCCRYTSDELIISLKEIRTDQEIIVLNIYRYDNNKYKYIAIEYATLKKV